MANDTTITVCGNTTAPAELRFTQSGVAVASFTIASTPRTFNRQTQEWEDGETLFMRCSAWREMAENIAESFPEKGTRVIAQGNLKQRSFQDREGNQRTSIELDVTEIGPSVKYATAKPVKNQRSQGGPQQQGGYQQPQQGYQQPQQAPQQGGWPPQGQQQQWPTQQAPQGQAWPPQGQQRFPDDPPPF